MPVADAAREFSAHDQEDARSRAGMFQLRVGGMSRSFAVLAKSGGIHPQPGRLSSLAHYV